MNLPEGILFFPNALDKPALAAVVDGLRVVLAAAPPQRTQTRGGGMTSAAMTNCGQAGWWSDHRGYRYVTRRPGTDAPWPAMPQAFGTAVRKVASRTPWPDFAPDACLINFYEPGAKMGLHQDRDERDLAHPIITFCLGDDADFLIGGIARGDKTQALLVQHGDALVMGGASRMRFHGIRKIYPNTSPLALGGRYSLTFRRAL
jgi:alkylated DNA repair protein (DNA oxidative demethylase)